MSEVQAAKTIYAAGWLPRLSACLAAAREEGAGFLRPPRVLHTYAGEIQHGLGDTTTAQPGDCMG